MPTQPTRQPRPGSRQKPRKRVVSPQRRAMYRRRRAVALVIVLAAVSLVVFCVYSLGRGVVDGVSLLRPTPIARESVPAPKKTSGVNDCGASDVKLSLTVASQGVPVGGSLGFTASISYEGTSSCLLDLSDVVLTVLSGDQTIYSSDSCPADPNRQLLAKTSDMNRTSQKMTWGASRTGDQCVEDQSKLPKVDRGTYTAQLSLKNAPKAVSDPVTIQVQ